MAAHIMAKSYPLLQVVGMRRYCSLININPYEKKQDVQLYDEKVTRPSSVYLTFKVQAVNKK